MTIKTLQLEDEDIRLINSALKLKRELYASGDWTAVDMTDDGFIALKKQDDDVISRCGILIARLNKLEIMQDNALADIAEAKKREAKLIGATKLLCRSFPLTDEIYKLAELEQLQ